MKVVFINPPFIRYDEKFKNIDNKIKFMESGFAKWFYHFLGRKKTNVFKKLFNLDKETKFGIRAGSRWPFTTPQRVCYKPYPFFMGYSAGLLKANGFEVDIIDAILDETSSYKEFINEVKNKKADIVVIECSSPSFDIDIWIAEKISKFSEVALAGPHITDENAETIKKDYPFVKYLLKGEYIKESLKMAKERKEGIYESDVVKDLDSIPFPYREYKNVLNYFEPSVPSELPQLQIYASKGCPFKCCYCSWPQVMYKGNVSLRAPEKIAQEIRECVEKYGYKSVFFDDDTFNMGTDRISKLCDYLKEIGIPWSMMGRLDCSPDWLFDKMVECGCIGMRFGVETFNIDVLKRINKGLERVDFKATIEHLTKKYPDILIRLTLMKNLPGQSDEIHQEDLRIIKELGFCDNNPKRTYQIASCVPFPGTKLYNDLVEKVGEEELTRYSLYDGKSETIMAKYKDLV